MSLSYCVLQQDFALYGHRKLYCVYIYYIFVSYIKGGIRLFENRIPKRIFGPKRDENEEWRRLHNEELHDLYPSPNIVRVIKYRRLRWAGHVARMEEERKECIQNFNR